MTDKQVGKMVRTQVGNRLWGRVDRPAWNIARDQVESTVRKLVQERVWNQNGNGVWDQVWDQAKEASRDG